MFTLPKLKFNYSDLEPHFDSTTMKIHHTKHHQTYIDKLNEIIEANPSLKNKKIEDLLLLSETKNMAGGHYNHSFFWERLFPFNEQKKIPEWFLPFKDEFNEKALKLFGSGWVWLVKDDGALKIITTPNQDAPQTVGMEPILGLDLWEHAYYLKYQNRRADYIEAFWNVVDWDFVSNHK